MEVINMKKSYFLIMLTILVSIIIITGCLTNDNLGDLIGRAMLEGGVGMSYGGIHVCLTGTNLSTTTNVTGNFIIPDVPAGTYTINFSFAGYVSQSLSITVPAAGGTTTVPDVTLSPQ